MAPVSIPIASRLPSSLRIASSNATVARVMSRLSRPSLLSLALDWLDEQNQALTAPYLRPPTQDGGDDDDEDEDSDDFYPPAHTLEDLQDYYADLQTRKGSKREVLDRMLEGDWRHGISMYQLAMADLQYLYDHPTSQKWTAFQIVPLKAQRDSQTPDGGDGGDDDDSVSAILDKASLVVPRFHPSSFLRNLQSQILPDIKVHYNFDRHKTLPLLLLRIFILDSPYNTSLATRAASAAETTHVEASRTVYIAFPDASPFVYLSSAQSSSAGGDQAPGGRAAGGRTNTKTKTKPSEARSLRSLVVEAIPKALSRPRERYALKSTNLATRNLSELLQRRGGGRTNTAGGGWGIYADEKTIESPLSTVPPPSVAAQLASATTKVAAKPANPKKRALSPGARRNERLSKRRKEVAAARFGNSARIGDGCGVERVDIIMQDPYPGGGRPPRDEQDEDEDEVEEDRGPRPDNRRKSKGGRRSQMDAVLAREDEEEEADEARRARRAAGADAEEDGADTSNSNSNDNDNDNEWRPRVAFTFQGPHVFAGIRQLVEAGIIDGEKMPGWMTGEAGVTVGAVRDGRIRGHKGSGMP